MELSKKSITNEQLCEKEMEIVKTITDIVDSYKEQYAQIGYELNIECTRRNDFDKGYTSVTEEPGDYVNGYSSIARIEILSQKAEQKIAAEPSAEDESADSSELESDEDTTATTESSDEEEVVVSETVEEVEERAARTKAYTEIMIARVYKVFWTTKVSYSEDFTDLKNDLEDFLNELK